MQINNWAWDLLFGCLAAHHLRTVHGLLQARQRPLTGWSAQVLRRLAGSTLVLYLLHLPMLSLRNALALRYGGGIAWTSAYLVLPMQGAVTLGYRLENTKHLWRRWFACLLRVDHPSKGPGVVSPP